MPDCSFACRIDAYHDQELDAPSRMAVEEHLEECEECRRELEALQQLSSRFATIQTVGLTQNRLNELYEANKVPAERPLMPFAIGLMATAASILVVCAAWLSEIAPVAPTPRNTVAVTKIPDWEKVAMTLQVEPGPGLGERTALADADFADWMLFDLSRGRQP